MARDDISHLNDPNLPAPASPFCHVVTDDRYAFLSGRVAADIAEGQEALGDIAAETELVMRSIHDTLARMNLGMERIVRVDVHLTDLGEIGAMDGVYQRFFAVGTFPARTCTEAGRLYGGCRIEITCIARL